MFTISASRLAAVLFFYVMMAGQPALSQAAPVVRLDGHEGEISDLAFSPDGRWLASGGSGQADHSLKLWDVATGKAVAAYNPELRGAAWSVVFAPDGKALLVGDLGLSVRVLSLPEVRERAAWPTSPERGYVAKHLAIAPDGKTVAAGLSDGTLLMYAADSGQVLRKLSQDSAITALAFSPDGKTLAAGTDFGLRLWDLCSGQPVFALEQDSTRKFELLALAFTPDNKVLVTGDSSGMVRFLSTADGKELRGFAMPRLGETTAIDALVISPDGKTVYCTGMLAKHKGSALFAGIVALDLPTARPLGVAKVEKGWGDHVMRLALSPDGKRLAVVIQGSQSIVLLDTAAVIPTEKLPD